MHLSDVWLHVEAYANKLDYEFKLREDDQKWNFYMTRQLCHTIHLHSPVKNHIKDANRFMPDPWQKKEKSKRANSPAEIWEEWQKKQAAKKETIK